MKKHLGTIFLCFTALISILMITRTYKNRNTANHMINVTGLGKKDFKSDLVIWSGNFEVRGLTLEEASLLLTKEKETVKKYLLNQKVATNQIVFSAVDIRKDFEKTYFENGNLKASILKGYVLNQTVKIESPEVDKIEEISRSITELAKEGISFYSYAPQYYYTKLSELKIEMVAAATEDARIRAEQIAENANAKIGNLQYAKMGIFQIIAQNSNEDLSWGGNFNTNSKMKTATITMKLQFGL